MKIHLETERLVLREFTDDDLNHLIDLDGDPEVLRYLHDSPPDEEAQREFIKGILNGYKNHPGFGFYVALEKPELNFVGWFHYRPDRRNPTDMEIGYRLKRSAWGRGLATEGSRALIEQGFSVGVRSVSGRTAKGNLGSRHVLEKLGLEFMEEYMEPRIPGDDKTAILLRRDFPVA